MRLFLALQVACLAPLASSQQIPLNEQLSSHSESTDHDNNDIPIADAAFEQYIRDKMARWHAPGLAMAILDGNKTWTRVSNNLGVSFITN
jgi:CubicO group peptidase (beta-lactamase class C family)